MEADSIISALEEQVECYRRLAKLAGLQHEHVQQGQTESLLSVLQKRQQVLDRVGELERRLAPVKSGWRESIGQFDGPKRARADDLLSQTKALLEQITAADRNDALVLQQRKLELGRQIKQTTAARQVNRSYAAAAYGARSSSMDVAR